MRKTKTKVAPTVEDFNYEINDGDFPFCCGVNVFGEFEEDEHGESDGICMVRIEENPNYDPDDPYSDYDTEIEVNWAAIPAKTIADLKAKFTADARKKVTLATTIISVRGKALDLKAPQGVANKVLRATGWKKVKDWKNPNTGNMLRLWIFDPK